MNKFLIILVINLVVFYKIVNPLYNKIIDLENQTLRENARIEDLNYQLKQCKMLYRGY